MDFYIFSNCNFLNKRFVTQMELCIIIIIIINILTSAYMKNILIQNLRESNRQDIKNTLQSDFCICALFQTMYIHNGKMY